MQNNQSIFNRVQTKTSRYGLVFISSNGGTGKTTYFKFLLLRDALVRNKPFHIYTRFQTDIEKVANSWTQSKPSYSKRKNKLLSRVELLRDGDDYFIIEKENKRKIAQFYSVHNQAKYKPIGNILNAETAIFDEVLAEDGAYCPNELNKFNRLVFTMARSNPYKVICLYNNTSPNFAYFSYYGGKSYNTHISKSGALFYYFTAKQYSNNDNIYKPEAIQSIIQNTAYNEVYNNNAFTQYGVFFKPAELRDTEVLMKIEIQSKIFKIRVKDGYLFLDKTKAGKPKPSKTLASINKPEETKLKQLSTQRFCSLRVYAEQSLIKTNDINDTIFCKILIDYLI